MKLTKDLIDYFLAPKQTGYDVAKTLLYASILVAAVYSIYEILKGLKVKIDQRLAVAVTPYIVFGAAIRVLQDAAVINSYFFMTPGIYVLVFGITFCALTISIVLQKRFSTPYHKITFVLGLLLLPFTLAQLDFANFYGGGLVFLFFVPWVVAFEAASKISSKISKWSLENKIVTLTHIFDATTTAVALSFFGYYEQHVLPTFFINIFGPFSFVFLKATVIIGILVLIDRVSDDKEFNNYLKLVIGILGAATGSRDFITLLAGV